MEKQSSFEKEFNRLSFLASIATGDNAEPTSKTTNSQLRVKPIPLSSVKQNISQIQTSAQAINMNGNSQLQKEIPAVNGLGKAASSGIDMEKIQKILNSNAQAINQSKQQLIYQNAMKQQNNLIIGSQSGTSLSAITSSPSTKPVVTQSLLTSQSSFIEQQKLLQNKVSSVMIKPPLGPTQTVAFTTASQTINPPLIISSSPQKVQSTVATNTGQTILLPANFAGITGKVLIVSNPGKPSQAIAINPSGAQTVVSLQNPSATNGKPVLLLPNTSSVGKTNAKAMQAQQMNANAVRMIVQNPAMQQMHPIQSIHQQMPGLTPVSLSSFQNIRPKGTGQPGKNVPSVPSANKVIIATPKNIQLPTTIHQITPTPTGFIQTNLTKPPPATVVSIVSVKPSDSTTSSSAALLSNFDKTMSQHLLQLEKTDPHLFKGGKINTNKTVSLLSSQTKQDKSKLIQHQQQLSQKQTIAQTLSLADKSKLSITTVHGSTFPTNILNSLPTAQGTPKSTVTLMPQMLASLQQQQQQQQQQSSENVQSALQDILNKQQLTKQTSKIATPLSQLQKQQQQQQQQMVSQLLAAAATGGHLTPQQKQATQQSLEMYLLQQKLLAQQQQQQQQQQKLKQHLQQSIPTPTQVSQMTKQMTKPLIQTNIKKVISQQMPISLPAMTSSNMNQPLKLLSSLTSMVNLMPTTTTTASKITLGKSSMQTTQPTQTLNIVQPGLSTTNVGIQPLLFQLSSKQQNALKTNLGTGIKQQITAAQLQELQKSYLASQLSAVGAKASTSQVQVGNTSVPINAKIPIQTVPTTNTKSAFAPRINTKTTGNISAQQFQLNQLIHQGVLTPSNANAMPALAKLQSSVTINKSLQEQLKLLTPAQRELFIKQYSAVAAGKQMQATLANTANPALLASILKNKQTLATATMTPKGVVQVPQQQTDPQPVKKGPKGSRGQKRTIAEAAPEPKKPEESPIEKRLKMVVADDQRRYLQPIYKRPFSTYIDALNRLRPYHITYEKDPTPDQAEKFDLLFSGLANNTMEKKRQLLHRFHHLMLRESILGWPSADDVLMGRLYGSTERERFEQQKKSLAEGRAFVVEDKETGRMECVALSIKEEAPTSSSAQTEEATNINNLQLSGVDNRLRIASKDIRNSEMNEDEEADEEKEEEEHEIEDDGDEATDELNTDEETVYDDDIEEEEEEPLAETIEIDDVVYEGQDNELAAATTNLLADMDEDNDEYGLDFN